MTTCMDSRWRMTTAFHLLPVCADLWCDLINEWKILISSRVIYYHPSYTCKFNIACIVHMLFITVLADVVSWNIIKYSFHVLDLSFFCLYLIILLSHSRTVYLLASRLETCTAGGTAGGGRVWGRGGDANHPHHHKHSWPSRTRYDFTNLVSLCTWTFLCGFAYSCKPLCTVIARRMLYSQVTIFDYNWIVFGQVGCFPVWITWERC